MWNLITVALYTLFQERQPIYTRSHGHISEDQEPDTPSHKQFKAANKIVIIPAKIQSGPIQNVS